VAIPLESIEQRERRSYKAIQFQSQLEWQRMVPIAGFFAGSILTTGDSESLEK
jgi:hypothetical protein